MTSTNDIQTETGARAEVLKLGLDVHATSIVVVRQIAAQVAQHFTPEQFPAFVRKQLTWAQTVHSCYEASPLGYVLLRQLTAVWVHNLVVRPRDWGPSREGQPGLIADCRRKIRTTRHAARRRPAGVTQPASSFRRSSLIRFGRPSQRGPVRQKLS